ncbi:MAG: hypothetical protein II754_02330 [Lachnospiraceae bacterium]|nr:hypothetical protein [Lachnospiraceae bacterium]
MPDYKDEKRRQDEEATNHFDRAFMRNDRDQEEEEEEEAESRAQLGGNEAETMVIDEQEVEGTPRAEDLREVQAVIPDVGTRIRDVVDEIHKMPFMNNEGAAQLDSITLNAEILLKTLDRQMPKNPSPGDAQSWSQQTNLLLTDLKNSADNFLRDHVRPKSREGKQRKRWVTVLGNESSRIIDALDEFTEGAVNVEGKETWGQAVAAVHLQDREKTASVGDEVGGEDSTRTLDAHGDEVNLEESDAFEMLARGFALLRDNPGTTPDEAEKESNSAAVVEIGARDFLDTFTKSPVIGDEDELLDRMDDFTMEAATIANAGNAYLREHRFTKTPEGRARKSGVAAITKFAELLRDTSDSRGNKLVQVYLNDIQEVKRNEGGEQKTVGIVWRDLISQYLGPNGVRKWNGSGVI